MPGTGALMQVVHILRAKKEAIADMGLKLRKRFMRCIRLSFSAIGAAFG